MKILITGASRGLGKILTEFLAAQGHTIFATVRNLAHFKNRDKIKYISLDLQKAESIEQAAKEVFKLAGTLDAVIHNAGVAYRGAADVLSDAERRHTFEVNFFGPVALTEKILPHFRRAKKGKLIFISSIVSLDHWPFMGIYSASKAALEAVAFEWAALLQEWNIAVSVIRPNPLPTDMQILLPAGAAASPYTSTFSQELLWEKTGDVCQLILKILQNPAPDFDYQTGPLSQQAIDAILQPHAYQKLLKSFRLQRN